MRCNASTVDLSSILSPEVEQEVKEMAEISMGTDIADEDMLNIEHLCKNVLEMQEYRTQLFEYLKNRMMAIAPNLTILVGELVGARLITHAGSLLNLAKHPASTVQILGAEKALFRALKTKHDTPKYGLIYHAQLIGQSNTKLKGKMSRMLASKSALACRVDALGESLGNELGVEHKAKLEARLKMLEEGRVRKLSGTGKVKPKFEKYEHKSKLIQYQSSADSTLCAGKRKFDTNKEKNEARSSNSKKPFSKVKDSEAPDHKKMKAMKLKHEKEKEVDEHNDAGEDDEDDEDDEDEDKHEEEENEEDEDDEEDDDEDDDDDDNDDNE